MVMSLMFKIFWRWLTRNKLLLDFSKLDVQDVAQLSMMVNRINYGFAAEKEIKEFNLYLNDLIMKYGE